MNVAKIETVSLASNSGVTGPERPGAGSVGSILVFPNRNLVGFLSLLNGVLDSSKDGGVPAVDRRDAAPLAMPQQPERCVASAVTLPRDEREKEGSNAPRAQRSAARKFQAQLNQTDPAPNPGHLTPLTPTAEPSGGLWSIAQFANEIVESSRSSSAPPRLNGAPRESPANVAFALCLIPKGQQTDSSPISAPPIRPGAPETAPAARPSTSPEQERAVPPSESTRQNIIPNAPQQIRGVRDARQELPRSLVEAPDQDSDLGLRNSDATGPIPSRESMRGVNDTETNPKSLATQPIPAETPTPRDSKSVSSDGTLESDGTRQEERTSSAAPIELRSSPTGSISAKGQVVSLQEQGNRPGGEKDEKNDPGPNMKAPKLYPAEKATTGQKDLHAPEATGLGGAWPSPLSGPGRSSTKVEAALDAPEPAQACPESDANIIIRPQPIREISLQLADNASNQVDIHVVERAGKVEVAVRTADQELTKALQTNLGELVGRMEEKGYKTETWIPIATLHGSAALTQPASSPGHSRDQPEHAGSWAGHEQQRQQQQSGRQRQPRWVAQVEETLDGRDAKIEAIRMENR